MLAIIQIPIIDLRGFVAPASRLPLPGWPAPEPDKDFLRGFGPIRRRPSGGLNGWLGEATICEAKRGVRFEAYLPQILATDSGPWQLRLAYRRFFSDGLATGKFEIGFDIRSFRKSDTNLRLHDAVSALLNLPLGPKDGLIRRTGRSNGLLSQAYTRASTPHAMKLESSSRLVLEGRPTVVIEHNGRALELPKRARRSEPAGRDAPEVTFWHQQFFGTDIPVWFLRRSRIDRREFTRELRIYICRFHAQTEAILKTLNSISVRTVDPSPRSPQSDRLQQFFLDAFRHQRQTGIKIDDKARLPFYQAALWHRDHALPGYYDGLLARISALHPRPAVRLAIENCISDLREIDLIKNVIVEGDIMINDIKNSAIGVIGNVRDSTVETTQNNNKNSEMEVVKQLIKVANYLKEQASTPDEKAAAQAVETAADCLSKGDEPSALAWLRMSRDWALKVAQSLGVKLASDLIIRACGR